MGAVLRGSGSLTRGQGGLPGAACELTMGPCCEGAAH
jgi:hypothetical protein